MKPNVRLDALTGLVFIVCLIVVGVGLFSLGAILFKDVYNSILSLVLSLPLTLATALICLAATVFITIKFRQKLAGANPTPFFIASASALSLSVGAMGWIYGTVYGVPVVMRVLVLAVIVVAIFVATGWLQVRRIPIACKWLVTAAVMTAVLYVGFSNYYTSLTNTFMKDLQQSGLTVYLLPSGPDYPRTTFFKPINGEESFAKGVEMGIEYKDGNRTSLTETKYTGINPVAACSNTESDDMRMHTYTCERLVAKEDISIFRKTETITRENPIDNSTRYYYTAILGQTQVDIFQGVYSETDNRDPKPSQHAQDEQQLLVMLQNMRLASESELKELISASQKYP